MTEDLVLILEITSLENKEYSIWYLFFNKILLKMKKKEYVYKTKMVYLLPSVLSGLISFRDVNRMMFYLSELRYEIKKSLIDKEGKETIISLPNPGETLTHYNAKYKNRGCEVLDFFKMQKRIYDECVKSGFECHPEHTFSSYNPDKDNTEILCYTKFVKCTENNYHCSGIASITGKFVLESDKNFEMIADLESRSLNNGERKLNIKVYIQYTGNESNLLFSEIDRIGRRMYLINFNPSNVDDFISKIKKYSIRSILKYHIGKYEKESYFDENLNLVKRRLPLLKKEYSIE